MLLPFAPRLWRLPMTSGAQESSGQHP